MSDVSEFDLIDRYLKPLAATAPGAFALTDDAAVLPDAPDAHAWVVTKDALSVGTHMLANDPPKTMAQKAVRVNLSDLASMGAKPACVFMALALGEDTSESFVREFVQGLVEDLSSYDVSLMGGDIIRQNGPFLVSITAMGLVPKDSVLRRAGAKPGDDVWVSGTMGDAALGLLLARDGCSDHWSQLSKSDAGSLMERFRVPQPRTSLGVALRGIATSCIDVSDGLYADLGHVCRASGVACQIEQDRLPLSDAAHAILDIDASTVRSAQLGGGDDYELCFTAPETARAEIERNSGEFAVKVTRIGKVSTSGDAAAEKPVTVVDAAGQEVDITRAGYEHV